MTTNNKTNIVIQIVENNIPYIKTAVWQCPYCVARIVDTTSTNEAIAARIDKEARFHLKDIHHIKE